MCVCVYGLELGEKRKKWKNISESIYVYIHTPKGIFSCVAAGLERNKWSRAGSDQSPEDPRIPRLGIGLSGHQKSWRAVAIAPGGPIPHWQLSARGGPLLLSGRAYPKLQQSLHPAPSPWNFISSLWLQEPRSHSVPQVDPPEMAGISKGRTWPGVSSDTPMWLQKPLHQGQVSRVRSTNLKEALWPKERPSELETLEGSQRQAFPHDVKMVGLTSWM